MRVLVSSAIERSSGLISSDGKFGYLVSWRNELQTVNARTGRYIRESQTNSRVETLESFSPDKRSIIAVSVGVNEHKDSGELLIFDAATSALIMESQTGGLVSDVNYVSPNGKFVITDGGYHRQLILNTATGKIIREIPLGEDGETWHTLPSNEQFMKGHLAISSNGERIYGRNDAKWELLIVNPETGNLIAESKTGGKVQWIENMSPDGKQIMVGVLDDARMPQYMILDGKTAKVIETA